jgi:hypothetical protein
MGLGDRLTEIGKGAVDIVAAPIGFVWDMANVPFDDDLSFGDPFSTALTRGVTGLSEISQGTGISGLARGVAGATPIDEALGYVIRQGELLYNQDYQRELNQTPFGIRDLPFTDRDLQPGDVSIAKLASIGTQTAGVAPGPLGLNQAVGFARGDFNWQEMWARADAYSPGMNYMASSLNLWRLPEEQRREVMASAAFHLEAGLVDAVVRWYAQPEVIVGKTIKVARARYSPDIVRRISLFQKRYGMDAAVNGSTGAADLTISGARDQPLFTVVRASEMGDDFRDSSIVLMSKEDDAARYAADLYRANPDDVPLVISMDPEGMPIMLDDISKPFLKNADGFADDAVAIGFVDDLADRRLEIKSPDSMQLDLGNPAYLNDFNSAPDHLKPSGKLSEVFYNPDGTPIEPRDLYRAGDIADTISGARRIYSELGETEAVKFIKARQAQLNPRNGPTLVDYIFSEKRVQRALNDMDGRDASYIRRKYFNDVTGGSTLSSLLAEATTYEERKIILAASMGIQVPEAVTLSPITWARVKALTKEVDAIRQGPRVAARNRTLYRHMTDETDWLSDPAKTDQLLQAVQEELDATVDQTILADFLNTARKQAFVKTPPRYGYTQSALESVRSSWVYQSTPLSRPIRSVTEMKAHRFLNVQDPQGDIQIVRQLEEASPLGIGPETVNHYRNRWMGAKSPAERVLIAHEMDQEIVSAALKKSGLNKKQFDQVITQMRRGKQRAGEILQSRRFHPDSEADIVRFVDDSGEVVEMAMPVLSTQMQNWIPLTDVRQLIRASSAVGRISSKYGRVPSYMMDSFYQLWKPSVLLRGGWPLRVVGDEQLRILAKTGSLIAHLQAIELGEMPKWSIITEKNLPFSHRVAAAFASPVTVGTAATARAARAVSRGSRKLRLTSGKYYEDMASLGFENAVSSRAAFNGPNANVNQQMEMLFGRQEAGILDDLINKSTGQWQSIGKGDRMYGAAWIRVLKEHISNDPMARQFLETVADGGNVEQAKLKVLDWLKNTSEGRRLSEQLAHRSVDSERWVDDIESLVRHYTVDYDSGLVKGTLAGKVNPKLLETIDEAKRPPVIHSEIVEQVLGKSVVDEVLTGFLGTSYDLMGRLPTDTLSRQPMYKEIFALEMRRIRKTLSAQGVDINEESVIQNMAKAAKAEAQSEVMTYLYNLAETSRFGQMMRWWMPFYPAWQEVLTVWGKLAYEDPSIIGRAMLLWKAPNRAGLVSTDQDGNEFIQFRLSEKMVDQLDLTGWSRYLAEGGIRFGKSSFNMVTNSPLPSAGPPIQIPINQVVRNKPELEESLRFLMPYGVEASWQDILFSPTVKRIRAWLGGRKSDDTYIRHFNNVVSWMDYQYRAGLRSDPPSLDEAYEIADRIFALQTFSNFTAPAQPIFDSPLKPYMDIYQDLQATLGDQADEQFLKDYGEEFISLTLSRTVSKTGIPPTVEAQVARRQVEDLISSNPEYGRLIIGEDAATGEFSTAAFAWQLGNPPSDDPKYQDEMERRYRVLALDPDTGRIEESDTRLGWNEYIKAMDLIDLEMKSRGVPNLRVKAAEDLAALKRALTQGIAEKYPSWWRDFNQRDDLKWDTRIKAFRNISNSVLETDPERADMRGIQDYIQYRDLIVAELNRRKQLGGSSSLSAIANQDLQLVWESLVFQIQFDNIAFTPIFHRYLEGDPVM